MYLPQLQVKTARLIFKNSELLGDHSTIAALCDLEASSQERVAKLLCLAVQPQLDLADYIPQLALLMSQSVAGNVLAKALGT